MWSCGGEGTPKSMHAYIVHTLTLQITFTISEFE